MPMYKRKFKQAKKLAAARQKKLEKRMLLPAPKYPRKLPKLRRKVIVFDYDFGRVVYQFDLYRSDRRDQYRIYVDRKPWEKMGWSRFTAQLRESFPRIGGDVWQRC